MAGDIEIAERVIAMRKRVGPFSIKDLLNEPEGKADPETPAAPPLPLPPGDAEAKGEMPSPEELPTLPGPGDAYRAYARAANKPLPTLVLLLADASAKGFSYGNLDTVDLLPGSAGQGPVIALTFSGIVSQEVRIAGRHLDRLYSYLAAHRAGWVRELSPSREFLPETEAVVTSITMKKVQG